jgi:phage-related protein
MAKTTVVFYREDDGRVPILEWLDSLQAKAQDKCTVRIERLQELSHQLRRPEADFLRDGIYELRIGLQHVNYRILCFFHGNVAAVISHGITKEDRVAPREIEKAIVRKEKFFANPELHTYVQDQL